MKKTVEDSEKSESSKTELENSTKKETYSTKGKLFLFTSHLTQDIVCPPIIFAVVKTNVNFQIVRVLVFQKETKDMIKKGLK